MPWRFCRGSAFLEFEPSRILEFGSHTKSHLPRLSTVHFVLAEAMGSDVSGCVASAAFGSSCPEAALMWVGQGTNNSRSSHSKCGTPWQGCGPKLDSRPPER